MGDAVGDVNVVRGGVTQAAHLGDERTTLIGALQRLRDLVAWKVRDASDQTLRSAATASGLTIPGVIRHLENVERWWFRDIFAGEPNLSYDWTDDEPSAEFQVPDEVSIAVLLAAYAEESARCDDVILGASSLEQVSATRGYSLRWIVIHLVQETARHLGQVDLLRELADGEVGEEPD